jgi:hypothetical protein
MPTAIITVAAKQSPAIGKKQGKIQDTAGGLWNVWGDKLATYREGVTYDITYEEGEFNGHRFNTIKTANPSNVGGQQYTPNPPERPAAAPRQAVQNAIIPPNAKDEMIFVCGIVNNSMSNTNINPFEITLTELITMVDKARSAWRATLGKSQSRNDMDDSIPF